MKRITQAPCSLECAFDNTSCQLIIKDLCRVQFTFINLTWPRQRLSYSCERVEIGLMNMTASQFQFHRSLLTTITALVLSLLTIVNNTSNFML